MGYDVRHCCLKREDAQMYTILHVQVHCLQQSFDPGWRRNARKGRKHSTADNRLMSGFMFLSQFTSFSLHHENVLYLYKFVFPTIIILLYKHRNHRIYSYCMYIIIYLSVKYYIHVLHLYLNIIYYVLH